MKALRGEGGNKADRRKTILGYKFPKIGIAISVVAELITVKIKNDRRLRDARRLHDEQINGVAGPPFHADDCKRVGWIAAIVISHDRVHRVHARTLKRRSRPILGKRL